MNRLLKTEISFLLCTDRKRSFSRTLSSEILIMIMQKRRKQESTTWNKIDGRNQSENASITEALDAVSFNTKTEVSANTLVRISERDEVQSHCD